MGRRSQVALERFVPVLLALILMWVSTGVNLLLLHGAWFMYGVRAHDPGGLWPDLLFAPFLHAGLAHLVANTAPFLILGGLIALQSPARFVVVSLAGAAVGGLVVWELAPPGSVTIGASGLVFAYFGWLIARAVRERSLISIGIGLVALVLYGGILWGLSPFQLGISWQGHLGGLLGGIGIARVWPTRIRERAPALNHARKLLLFMVVGIPHVHRFGLVHRPGVAAAEANPDWENAGFGALIPTDSLSAGPQTLAIYAHTPDKGWWYKQVEVIVSPALAPAPVIPPIEVNSLPIVAVEKPVNGQVVLTTHDYDIFGYALDKYAKPNQGVAGSGVDRVEVYLGDRDNGGISLGDATLGYNDTTAASLFGARFASAGWRLTFTPTHFDNNTYLMYVYAHSAVSGKQDVVNRFFAIRDTP